MPSRNKYYSSGGTCERKLTARNYQAGSIPCHRAGASTSKSRTNEVSALIDSPRWRFGHIGYAVFQLYCSLQGLSATIGRKKSLSSRTFIVFYQRLTPEGRPTCAFLCSFPAYTTKVRICLFPQKVSTSSCQHCLFPG